MITEPDDKPAVKSYCGGKPNYCTPVDNVNMSEERVHKSDKSMHEWVGLTPLEFNSIKDTATTIGYAIIKTEAILREKNG